MSDKFYPKLQLHIIEMDKIYTITEVYTNYATMSIDIPANLTEEREYYNIELIINMNKSGIVATVEVLSINEELQYYEVSHAQGYPDVLPDEGGTVDIHIWFKDNIV